MHGSMTRVFWCAVLLACAPAASFGQKPAAKDYPAKPIRLVVPYVPGGTIDIIGHLLGQKIGPAIGQNLFIDNRPGAGGAIGTDVAAKAAPDGYTILIAGSSHTTLPTAFKNLPYDPVKDFAPIMQVARSVGSVLAVHPSVPARSMREFIALAKVHPGKLNYGSGGVGNIMQFRAEAFNLIAGTQMTHVPYKGAGQAIVDLVAGRIDVAVITVAVVAGHIRAGRLRALGLTAPERWSELPDVPTMYEAGVEGYKDHMFETWYGMWFPAKTPTEYVTRIRAEVIKAFDDPAARHALSGQGLIPVTSTPQEFGKTILQAIEFNRSLAARMGLTPQ